MSASMERVPNPQYLARGQKRPERDQQNKVSYSVPVVAFLLLSAMILLNLNGAVSMAYGIDRAFSIVMLALIGIVILAYPSDIKPALGRPGKLYLLSLGSYLAISALVRVSSYRYFSQPFWETYQIYLSTFPIILVFAVVGFRFARRGQLEWVSWRFWTLAVVGISSVYLSRAVPSLYRYATFSRAEYRYSGFFANPNEAGLAGCMALALGLGWLASGRKPLQVVIGIAILSGAIVLTFSRASLLLLVALLGLGAYWSPQVLKGRGKIAMFVVTSCMVALLGWFIFRGANRIGGLEELQRQRVDDIATLATQGDLNDDTTGGRLSLAREGIDLFLEAPLWGVGFGALRRMPGVGLGVHNTLILVIGESGILPGVLFLCTFYIWGRTAWRCPERVTRLSSIGALLVLGVAFMVGHNVLEDRFLGAFLGLSFGSLSGAHRNEG